MVCKDEEVTLSQRFAIECKCLCCFVMSIRSSLSAVGFSRENGISSKRASTTTTISSQSILTVNCIIRMQWSL